MKSIINILFVAFAMMLFVSCDHDDYKVQIEDRDVAILVEGSITPSSASFCAVSNLLSLSYVVYISSSENDIESVIQYTRKNKNRVVNLGEISSHIIELKLDNKPGTCYNLNKDTKYYYTAIGYEFFTSFARIVMQPIQSFTTPAMKDWVDMGTNVLWCGYNYFKDGSIPDNFIEAMNPPLFYKSELPELSNETYRYPTKQELKDLANNCEVVYGDSNYKFAKLKSKINGEELFVPFTWWSGNTGTHKFPDSGVCFFPSINGEWGLKCDLHSGLYITDTQFYTWTGVDGEHKERRGVRLVKDK